MAGIMSVFLAYISKMIIDTSTLKNISMFRKTVILAVAFIVLNFIIYVLRGYFKSKYLKNIMFQVNHDLFETLIRRNITSFNRENSSVYVSAFNNDLKLF